MAETADLENGAVELPVLFRDTQQDFIAITHERHSELDLDPVAIATAQRLRAQQVVPHWYVDGTCSHPTTPTAAHAARSARSNRIKRYHKSQMHLNNIELGEIQLQIKLQSVQEKPGHRC